MKHIIKVNEQGLALLKAAEIEFQLIATVGKVEAKLIPGEAKAKKAPRGWSSMTFYTAIEKLPEEGDKSTNARVARIVDGYLIENKLMQVDRKTIAKIVAKKIGWAEENGIQAIRNAVKAGFLRAIQ